MILCGDCIITNYLYYRSSLTYIFHDILCCVPIRCFFCSHTFIFHWIVIPLYTATPCIMPSTSFPEGGGIKRENSTLLCFVRHIVMVTIVTVLLLIKYMYVFCQQMLLQDRAEALLEEADSLVTMPTDVLTESSTNVIA